MSSLMRQSVKCQSSRHRRLTYFPKAVADGKRRRIERGFSMGLWAEIRKPAEIRQRSRENRISGILKSNLSGLRNGAIRRTGPEPSGLEAHVGEGGRCAVRIR